MRGLLSAACLALLQPLLSLPRRPLLARPPISLRCARGVPSTDVIEPAKYRTDLYGVLGVPRNATAKELKQAYWNLALSSHPDRNASLEALYVFQNASYAYSILGRDPRKRQEYDTRVETSEFISTLGQVSSDVGSVAGPLLNMTYNAALPFLKDALDFSTAAFEALVDEQTDGSGVNMFDRLRSAIGMKGVEQRIRRATEQLQSTRAALDATQAELVEAMATEKTSREAAERVGEVYRSKESVLETASAELRLVSANLSAEAAEESALKSALELTDNEIDVAMKRAVELDASIARTSSDIAALQETLIRKKDELAAMQAEETASLATLELNVLKAEGLRASFSQQSAVRVEVESAFTLNEESARVAQEELSAATREKAVASDAFSRQAAYVLSLQSKLARLTSKAGALQTSIDKDYGDWKRSKEEAEQERIRLADLRRRQEEDEAYAAEVAQMEALKVRVEKRNREMLQMDAERVRLEALAREEMEMVRVAEEKIRSKNRT